MSRSLLALLSLSFFLVPMRCAQAQESSLKSRRVRITYAAEIANVPPDARDVRLWIPFPPGNESQQVSNITVHSDAPASIERDDEYGNQIVSLALREPGSAPVRVELQYDVVRRERRNTAAIGKNPLPKPDSEKLEDRWLTRDRLVPIDGKVFDLAQAITRNRNSPLDQARAIYDHTVSTLTYDKSGTGWGRGDIAYACDAKRGNCTDFHAVFIGLCRARGIPARFEIGVSLPTDKTSGEIAGYHCWADCHLADYGWIPVDCSEAQKHPEQREYFFGSHDEHRVAFSTGRDIRLSPPQQGERLNFFVYPYAEIDGRPHEKVERKITFENLEPTR